MARIYTKTGDDGTTGLVGGARVGKDDARLECYGTIDELNAAVGLAAVAVEPHMLPGLRAVQAELFVLGSHLATPADSPMASSLPRFDPAWTARLEHQMDAAEAELPPLRNFILPGGTDAAARLHLARTVCRRAERLLVAFARQAHPVDPIHLTYLNRLSDWFFVQARLANHRAGIDDIPWKP
jgi:cob(I)alamin adenosyltransferase